VVSEFLPGTPPLAHNFPRRNRILAALSSTVVVVEAGEASRAALTGLAPSLPGAVLVTAVAGGERFAPFDSSHVRACAVAGEVVVLLLGAPPPEGGEGLQELRRATGFPVVVAPGERAADRPLAVRAAELVELQDGTRPFLLGLDPAGAGPDHLQALASALRAATDGLPSYRSTTLVVLGERVAGGTHRLALRADLAPRRPGRHDLQDLLEDRP